MQEKNDFMKKIINHLKEYGFVFQGSEIYGGLANTWDYGHLGAILKKKIKNAWWDFFIKKNPHNISLDSSIILNSKVWKASGHLNNFNDPLIDCKDCKFRFRADSLIQHYFPETNCDSWTIQQLEHFIEEKKIKCSNCNKFNFTKIRQFQLMFETSQSSIQNQGNKLYLRPETAQGIFINFNNYKKAFNKKLPFGVGQIGKSFRNEITPGNFIFRTLEFEQMELEFFYSPLDTNDWFNYWLKQITEFIELLGIKNYQLKEHTKEELSHYSLATTDIQYQFPFGLKELCGLANRGDYDLLEHSKESKVNLSITDYQVNKVVTPYVIEPSMGIERLFLAIICENFDVQEKENKTRTILKLNPIIAPYHVAVASLNKKKLGSQAKEVFDILNNSLLDVFFDERNEIGKVYNYNDQIGTPYCVTIDYQTETDKTVTVRDRDEMIQERIAINKLKDKLYQKLNITY